MKFNGDKYKTKLDTLENKINMLIEPTVKQQKYPNLYVYGSTHYLNIADILSAKDQKTYLRLHNQRVMLFNEMLSQLELLKYND